MSSFLEVLVNLPLPQSFTYKNLDSQNKKYKPTTVGMRCEIYFGSRKMIGCIINISNTIPPSCTVSEEKIKPIIKIIDDEPIFFEEQIKLSEWISKYYLCSQGEALFTMLPSGKRESSFSSLSFEEDEKTFTQKILSEEQKKAIDEILNPENKKIFNYLYGPTGTGKTEVFLSCAEKVLNQDKGVIYLVPEISLTHQVIEAVIKRFGNTVAVLHSGLTGSQKLKEWMRIINREAKIVIGARSGIFAPVPNLGLIIIDEEHDGSYKSGTTPRYHARQVAMRICTDKKIPLIMGSATPSVEAWKLMKENKIQTHTLSKRLAGGAIPKVEIINLSEKSEDGRITEGCISPKLEDEIRNTLQEKKQTILFLNRRGFSHFFKCSSCGFELKCKNCSVSLTYHKTQKKLICHYCGWQLNPPTQCPECKSLDVGYFGFGTEFIESEVKAKFPNAVVERIDTDNLSSQKELQEKLDLFRNNKIDILLGTQMVAKGLNFPNLKLVGVIMADTGLHLPDFRASERTFSLIVQVAGRAGRFFPDGKVIVQSYSPNRSPIYYACKNRIEEFYDEELQQRKILDFPPFSRLIRLVFRSPIKEASELAANSAAEILESFREKYNYDDYEILGPSECPLSKIAANYRNQIILRSDSIKTIQSVTARFIYNYKNKQGVYLEVDVDPTNLL